MPKITALDDGEDSSLDRSIDVLEEILANKPKVKKQSGGSDDKKKLRRLVKRQGGKGSGNFGHSGLPGKHGGSRSKGAGGGFRSDGAGGRSGVDEKKIRSEVVNRIFQKLEDEGFEITAVEDDNEFVENPSTQQAKEFLSTAKDATLRVKKPQHKERKVYMSFYEEENEYPGDYIQSIQSVDDYDRDHFRRTMRDLRDDIEQTYNNSSVKANEKLRRLVHKQGGKGSGNFGHSGLPGKHGGSRPKGAGGGSGGTSKKSKSEKDSDDVQKARALGGMLSQLQKGGFSTSLAGENPPGGFMTATSTETEVKILASDVTSEMIADYAIDNLSLLQEDNAYLGGWLDKDKETGETFAYLDVSTNVQDMKGAIDLGSKSKQIGIYDLKNDRTLYIDYQRNKAPYYLEQWDDPGSPRVYV
jgi:hypothetical protein